MSSYSGLFAGAVILAEGKRNIVVAQPSAVARSNLVMIATIELAGWFSRLAAWAS
jgi:hypothetical protein